MRTTRAIRLALVIAVGFVGLVFATPALAMHPEQWNEENPNNPNRECNEDVPEGFILGLPSDPNHPEGGGEAWECKYDPVFDAWYWEPAEPGTTPYDATGWIDFAWADSGVQPGVSSFLIQGYNEWIDNSYRGGYFVSVDHPSTSAGIPANQLGVYQGLYAWNSTTNTWDACNSTGWEFGSGTGNIINITNTADYGAGACGYTWYNVLTWIEVWNPSTGSWDESPGADPSSSAGQNVGYAPYASNGFVYDPAAGGLGGPLGWLGSPPPVPTRAAISRTSRAAGPTLAANAGVAPPTTTRLTPAGVANVLRNHTGGITPVRAIGAAAR